MADSKKLTAGFTGAVQEPGGITTQAKDAVRSVRREASAAVTAAQDHQTATTTALLVSGILGLALGYALGSSTEARRNQRSSWF